MRVTQLRCCQAPSAVCHLCGKTHSCRLHALSSTFTFACPSWADESGRLMPLRDYEAEDEDDFYGQGFEEEGVVSIWLGLSQVENDNVDVLQDLCGVGYYDLDNAEANCCEFRKLSVRDLLAPMSYSHSFLEPTLKAAQERAMHEGRWVTLQFDFRYDPSKVKRPVAADPVFPGAFNYSRTRAT